ncbi:MAG: aminotransferase class I/II-fold pyridoxal phosphate-dependent enzyme [Pirellulales bacterium]|nr:aminotransferase class I/II-fold pyridoxal phosphate-dependent enzyme [Pirellulales bacterium]
MHLDKLPGTFFGPPTLVDLVRHRASHQPDEDAFVYLVDGEDEQLHLSYRQLDQQARGIAAWLEDHNLVGERALLLYPAGLDFIAAFFGCLYAGVTAVPVYPPRRNRSLERIEAVVDDAEAKVALTTDSVYQRVEPIVNETPRLKALAWLATCDVPDDLHEDWRRPDIHGDTMAFLQYTSGSTGTPKGVMLNHANLLHNSAMIAHAFEHTRSGTGVFWLPSYHDMGLIGGILQPLYVGRPNILMAPMSFLQKPFRWLSAVSRFRCTTSGGPNFAYDLCVQKITPEQREQLDLSTWKVAFNGAEPVREETIRRFTETFEPYGFHREAFYPCYGMAEAALLVSGGYVNQLPVIRSFDAESLTHGEAVPRKTGQGGTRDLVGCGGTLADQKIAIVDPETLKQLPDSKVGEIWVRGPSVAQGYWHRPEVNKEVFQAHIEGSGAGPFLRTGDLGFMLDGELFVTGRMKDLIILHGVNHYPQDIELTVQRTHKRLRKDCGAAFTVEVDGKEKLVVVQEIEKRKQGNLTAVFNSVRRAVSAEHELALDAIVMIKNGSIPKTSSGKVQRHACRNGYLDGSLNVVGKWELADGEEPILPAKKSGRPKPVAQTLPVEEKETVKTAEEKTPTAPETPAEETTAAPVVRKSIPKSDEKLAELVLEQVRLIARERAKGLTLDTPIIELGMDSLERIDILAALEERFGGRFPEEVLPDLETGRHVVEAVKKYLGTEPRPKTARPTNAKIPTEWYRVEEFPEYRQLKSHAQLLEATGLHNPFFNVHQSVTNNRTIIGGKEYINFSSYNYVGMSGDPVVVKAAQDAAAKYGTSVSASRLVSGEKDIHGELEREIAQFLGTEDTILFVGGHSTNETVIGHLFGPGDLILHDSLSHNSILQGCILSGARRRPFAHNNWEEAERLLKDYRHEYRRVLVVIEGVYSMDGDIPDLPKFVEIKNRHKSLLMIDEAHSIGTIGKTGHGIGEYHGVDPKDVEIWMATLSKTFGSCGGYISGSKALVEYLKYTAPGFVFSVGLSPPNTAAALASLRLLKSEPERVTRLQERSRLLLDLAKQHGLNTGMSYDSPVVPIILGSSIDALKLSQGLLEHGINVQPILYPAVEESAARLRFFVTTDHTEEQIRTTVDAMVAELNKIDPKYLQPNVGCVRDAPLAPPIT